MVRVVVQYKHQGKAFSVDMGDWPSVPDIGDELGFDGGVLIVKKRRWKVRMKAWERELRVALKCEVKQ